MIILDDEVPNLECSNTPVSCFEGSNGSVSVLATGGVSPYQYNWEKPII
ncbi:MAG: hypothetical protein COA88_03845 [Kordia sp.]|nr:MAG: hypothetical protein COA88_03845 [Kordia sp.]